MNRDYIDGKKDDVKYFIGIEVEQIPTYGEETLYVATTDFDIELINKICEEKIISNIYFGANKCLKDYEVDINCFEFQKNIKKLLNLNKNFFVIIDIPYKKLSYLPDWVKSHKRIHFNISIEILEIESYNSFSVKFDDVGFCISNPGVWVFNLEDGNFTSWKEYKNDEVIDD